MGKGGFGKVYAAQRIEDNMAIVAIKKISKRRLLSSPSTLQSVWIERDVMSKVRSPFCVHILHAYQVRFASVARFRLSSPGCALSLFLNLIHLCYTLREETLRMVFQIAR